MEHLICSSLVSHAEHHNILYPLQHGFRPCIKVYKIIHGLSSYQQREGGE